MAAGLQSACALVDSLAALQLDVLTRINKKFAALQNLAVLLEQLADLSAWIPDLTGLIPVIDIDVSMYNAIAANCPYLQLPPATDQLLALQGAVTLAYTTLFKQVARSPHFRLGKLQAEMFKFQASINTGMSQAGDFLACLQSVCAAGLAVQGSLKSMSSAQISKEITTFAANYAAKAGNVLSETGQAKLGLAQEAMQQLSELGASSGKDYADAKAALRSQ